MDHDRPDRRSCQGSQIRAGTVDVEPFSAAQLDDQERRLLVAHGFLITRCKPFVWTASHELGPCRL
jgi:hypothetical protein